MTVRLTSGIIAATLFCGFAHADWRFEAETGAVYDSNLSNSDRSSDVRDDWAWRSYLSANNGLQLTRDLRFNLGADIRGEVWNQFDAFNSISGAASTGLRYRLGLGRSAPWISLDDRFGYLRVHDTAQSGYDNVINLHGGIALSDRVALESGYAFQTIVAPDNFYDRQIHRGNVRMIVDATSSLQVAFGYTYREGDVISYAVPPRPEIAAFAIEREDEDDFGFPLRTAYKFPGRTHTLSVSAAYQLTRHASVQLGYEYNLTVHDPIEYEKHLFELKIAVAY
jgi:hypothetical protein